MRPRAWLALALALTGLVVPSAAQQQAPRPTFRSDVDLVVVDIVVRDRNGALVRGLTADDFEVLEDNSPQAIVSFNVEEITEEPVGDPLTPVLAVGAREITGTTAAAPVAPRPQAQQPAATPAPGPQPPRQEALRREDLAGRRLIVLLFDLSSMQPEELDRAGQAAVDDVDAQMTPADLVAVATIDTTLNIVSDFSNSREEVLTALSEFVAVTATGFETVVAETTETDEAAASGDDAAAVAASSEFDLFNNDARLRAIRTLSDMLAPIEQKKSVLYFSGGMARSGGDNQVELRSAISTAVRANVALYPVDTRGLQAVVPGGDASRASARGVAAFSGRGVSQQFNQLFASQETLQTLAADTGGQAFTDSNDFGDAFVQVQRDTSSYYLLGYNSPNTTRDGKYRRITVRLKDAALRVDHRAGYYADRDFQHTAGRDRERLLEEQITAPVSATDFPVVVSTGWFRQAPDRYFVPMSVAVPGSALRRTPRRDSLDILGVIIDEQGRRVGRVRDTLDLPPDSLQGTARQFLYQSGLSLPPGLFTVKVVVRENADGAMGTFETPIFVPDLTDAPVKVSSVTLSTQLRPAGRRRSESPLIRDGLELLPSLTHVVDRNQRMYFYYEVYDPAAPEGQAPRVKTSLAFYRGTVKVFETPLVERVALDAADRSAALFQFEVPADRFEPGLYTCQVNIIDDVAGTFVFPRLALYVRAAPGSPPAAAPEP
jgi:VWFA-related protein